MRTGWHVGAGSSEGGTAPDATHGKCVRGARHVAPATREI